MFFVTCPCVCRPTQRYNAKIIFLTHAYRMLSFHQNNHCLSHSLTGHHPLSLIFFISGSNFKEVRSGRSSGFGGGDSSSSFPESPVPPAPVPPPKKLSLKLGSGLKQRLHTPPTSPALPSRAPGSVGSGSSSHKP
jgi:hypothetical protein